MDTMAAVDRGAAVFEAVRAMGRVRRRVLREIATPYSEAGAGVLTTMQELGPVRQNALAAHLHVDPSVVSRQLSTLHHAALVERVVDPADGRAHLVQISDKGTALLRQIREDAAAQLGEVLIDWPQADFITLTTLLQRLDRSLSLSTPELSEGFPS